MLLEFGLWPEDMGGCHPELGLPAAASREGGSRDLGPTATGQPCREAERFRLRRDAPALNRTRTCRFIRHVPVWNRKWTHIYANEDLKAGRGSAAGGIEHPSRRIPLAKSAKFAKRLRAMQTLLCALRVLGEKTDRDRISLDEWGFRTGTFRMIRLAPNRRCAPPHHRTPEGDEGMNTQRKTGVSRDMYSV